MNIGLVLLLLLLAILFGVTRLLRPVSVKQSRFEIERRVKEGDAAAIILRDRERVAPIINALREAIGLILLLVITVVLFTALGGFGAVVVTLLIALAVAWIVRIKFVKRRGDTLMVRLEPRLFKLYGRRKFFAFLPLSDREPSGGQIDSEAELLHIVDRVSFLDPERRSLIRSSLEFTGLTVADAMSGKRSIKTVDKADVLGPLVLDELYKTGKQSFLVVDGNLDSVVGILKLDRLTSLDLKDSPTALKAMTPDVPFVQAESSITDALTYLRSSKAPFLVVQDDESRTVGLLTMDNILRCLFEQ